MFWGFSARGGSRLRILAFASLGLGVGSASALTINPIYGASITGNANAAAIMADLNRVCAFYNANFADPITVNIDFENVSSGLGSNNPSTSVFTYTQFRSALAADATTATDATALAHLPTQTNNPVNNTANVRLSKANARAIGLSAAIGVDDTINLNTGLCFLNHDNPVGGQYDLYGVACHEMDEALGTVSGDAATSPWSADMYRYDELGVRSYNTDTSKHAFFSLDGTTDIVEYNQIGRTNGDWGDWIHHATPQVQDWSGTPGQKIDMGPSEIQLLDAVGYDYHPTPEPATWAALGLGALAIVRRTKRRK